MKKLALHWQILIGMLLGLIFGFIMLQFSWGKDFTYDFIKPLGSIFVKLLKLIAIPLILASLIKGISDLKDISKNGGTLGNLGEPGGPACGNRLGQFTLHFL